MITIYLAPFVALVGVLLYAFANPNVKPLAVVAFGCGLLVTLLQFAAGRTIHF